MKRLSIAIFIACFVTNFAWGQERTYIGVDFGYKGDVRSLTDNGSSLMKMTQSGLNYGFNIGHELSNNLILESGIYSVNYWHGVNFKESASWSSGSSFSSIQVPIRLKRKINIYKNKLLITPYFGVNLAYNLSGLPKGSITGHSSGSFSSPDTYFEYNADNYGNLSNFFFITEGGFSIDYKNRNDFQWSIITSYNQGLSKVSKQVVRYTVNDESEQSGVYTSKGSNFQVLLSLKYPISNFWLQKEKLNNKKEERIQEIKKHGTSKFYIQTGLGTVWNSFTNSSPSIYGNDKDDNLFWNTDLIFNINFGYNITNKISIETGIYSQWFRNRYFIDLKYSGRQGGGFYSGSTGFKRIPLNIKYNFSILNERLKIVPYLGSSILTHSQNIGQFEKEFSEHKSITATGFVIEGTTTVTGYRLRKMNLILNTGLGLEYALTKRFIITFYGDYSLGFDNINKVNVVSVENEFTQEGDVYYNGTNFNLNCGIKIPIGFKLQE